MVLEFDTSIGHKKGDSLPESSNHHVNRRKPIKLKVWEAIAYIVFPGIKKARGCFEPSPAYVMDVRFDIANFGIFMLTTKKKR